MGDYQSQDINAEQRLDLDTLSVLSTLLKHSDANANQTEELIAKVLERIAANYKQLLICIKQSLGSAFYLANYTEKT